MEKLIYLLERRDDLSTDGFGEALKALVPELKALGARDITVNVADLNDEVAKRTGARIAGGWDKVSGAVHVWLDCLDSRDEIEGVLSRRAKGLDGYLVTESVVQRCERSWGEGERRPGVTQFALGMKPQDVSDEDFYARWQGAYGPWTFQLHPLRHSYVRNAVARTLTPGATPWRFIVLEHWHALEDFTDDDRYFGSPALAQKNFEDIPGFVDLSTITVGPMSEYHFG